MSENETVEMKKPYTGAKRGPKPKKGKAAVRNRISKICLEALEVLDRAVKGDMKITREHLDAAKFAINQDIGLPATKAQVTEDIVITVREGKPPENLRVA